MNSTVNYFVTLNLDRIKRKQVKEGNFINFFNINFRSRTSCKLKSVLGIEELLSNFKVKMILLDQCLNVPWKQLIVHKRPSMGVS